MDWSKAKNILIIAFIITNIFLIYNIEKNMFYRSPLSALDKEYIQTVEEILKENNIYIKTKIPQKVLKMPILNVAYEKWDKKRVNQAIQQNWQGKIPELDTQKAISEAKKFIKQNGWMKKDVIYWDVKKEKQGYRVIFKQKYKNNFLEYSYMECLVTQSGIKSFDKLWLKPISVGENKKEIIPAAKALLKLKERLEDIDETIIIKDIELGYLFDPNRMGFKNVESGRAVPAWRFVLGEGETVFIDAYME